MGNVSGKVQITGVNFAAHFDPEESAHLERRLTRGLKAVAMILTHSDSALIEGFDRFERDPDGDEFRSLGDLEDSVIDMTELAAQAEGRFAELTDQVAPSGDQVIAELDALTGADVFALADADLTKFERLCDMWGSAARGERESRLQGQQHVA